MTDSAILNLLWRVSLQAALLGAVVWAISWLTSKAPAAWRCGLWVVVLAKFLVPPLADVPAGLAFWQRPAEAQQVEQRLSLTASSRPIAQPAEAPSGLQSPAPAAAPTPSPTGPAAHVDPLLAAWLAGIAAMFGLLVVRSVRQLRTVRQSTPGSDELMHLLREAGEQIGLRRVPALMTSPTVEAPMLVGCFRPTVLLPEAILDRCPQIHLRAMLLHELAHIRRKDLAVVWLHQLVQILFFFHPIVWLAGREIKRERELACDALVVASQAITPRDYAAGYVSALRLANGVPTPSSALGMAEPFDMEQRRLNLIMNASQRRLTLGWTVALLVLAAIGLPTFAGVSRAAEPKAAPPRLAARPMLGKPTTKPPLLRRPPTPPMDKARVLAGLTAIKGPGVTVTLRDSPKRDPKEKRPEVVANYLIHDIDVSRVISELWSAGAEAISINDQRVVANTVIRASGRTIMLNNVAIEPPYTLRAIGKPSVMRRALAVPGSQCVSLFLLDMITVKQSNSLVVPASKGEGHFDVGRPIVPKPPAAEPRTPDPVLTQPVPSSSSASDAGFALPCDGPVTSRFGLRVHPITGVHKLHAGIDITVPSGTQIHAAADGTVLLAKWMGAYGYAVVIDHGGGVSTLYGHNSKLLVKPGDSVCTNDVIADSGSTGYSASPHCHFEKRINGRPVDPIPSKEPEERRISWVQTSDRMTVGRKTALVGKSGHLLEISPAVGKTVRAAGDGVITTVEQTGERSYTAVVDYGDNIIVTYLKCLGLTVQAGERVSKGQTIAQSAASATAYAAKITVSGGV